MTNRFTFRKSESGMYVVEDHKTDRCEDATLYCFKTMKKAKAFIEMLIVESKSA